MVKSVHEQAPILSYYSRITLWLGIITIIVIPPFSIANLVKGHYILSLICFSFMVLLVTQCIMIRQDRYHLNFTLVGLLPAITLYIFFQIYTHGIVGVFWSFPASMILFFILPRRYAIKASASLLVVNIPLIFIKIEPYLAGSISLALVLLAVFSAYVLSIIEQQQVALSNESLQKRMQVEALSSELQPAIDDISKQVEQIMSEGKASNESALLSLSCATQELNKKIDQLFCKNPA